MPTQDSRVAGSTFGSFIASHAEHKLSNIEHLHTKPGCVYLTDLCLLLVHMLLLVVDRNFGYKRFVIYEIYQKWEIGKAIFIKMTIRPCRLRDAARATIAAEQFNST